MSQVLEKTAGTAFLSPTSLASQRLRGHVRYYQRRANRRDAHRLERQDSDLSMYSVRRRHGYSPGRHESDFSSMHSMRRSPRHGYSSPRHGGYSLSRQDSGDLSVRSSRSRRSASVIMTAEDQKVFDGMSATTGVKLRSPPKKKRVRKIWYLLQQSKFNVSRFFPWE